MQTMKVILSKSYRILSFFLPLVSYLLFVFPSSVSAHLAGQPPFFKVNGTYANYYPIISSSALDFPIPQDLAPKNYLVNEELHFVIDTEVLPYPPELIEKTTFRWKFGDGVIAEGLENTHTYTIPKSYILTVHADFPKEIGLPPQFLIQSMLLHVLPNKNYKLPNVKIEVNSEVIDAPSEDFKSAKFVKPIKLTAKQISASAKIAEYLWDLGDGEKAKGRSLIHTYANNRTYVSPILRVTDEHGFMTDTYAVINNQKAKQQFIFYPLFFVGLGGIILFVTTVMIVRRNTF